VLVCFLIGLILNYMGLWEPPTLRARAIEPEVKPAVHSMITKELLSQKRTPYSTAAVRLFFSASTLWP
jgi:hypothetical protein